MTQNIGLHRNAQIIKDELHPPDLALPRKGWQEIVQNSLTVPAHETEIEEIDIHGGGINSLQITNV